MARISPSREPTLSADMMDWTDMLARYVGRRFFRI